MRSWRQFLLERLSSIPLGSVLLHKPVYGINFQSLSLKSLTLTGHRNVYVAIHMPYSRSKHKHRGRRKSSNGQGKHGRSHRRSSEMSSTLEEVSLDGESLSLGGIEERRRSSFHGQGSGEGEGGLLKRPSYHKSLSAPSSRPRTPPNELATLPTIMGEL